MVECDDAPDQRDQAPLDLKRDKSGSRCPTPQLGRAFELHDGRRIPIPCGRNSCPVCRRRNVMVTAAMLGLNETFDVGRPARLAITTTTRDWIDDATLREGTAQFARLVRREVSPTFEYAWMREWTTGTAPKSNGERRTHKHWTAKGVSEDDAEAIRQIAVNVWRRIAGADQHFVQRVWDAGGIARYVAGLVGHHLKSSQAPPSQWRGRRFGTSKRYYAIAANDLRSRAEAFARDQRLIHRLEREMASSELPDGLTTDLWDELLTVELERAKQQPPPRVVLVPHDWWERTKGRDDPTAA